MLSLILQKIRNKKGMVLSLLLGNILLVSIVCCNVIYTRASLQRMINTSFSNYLAENGSYPMRLTLQSGLTATMNGVQNLQGYYASRDAAERIEEDFGVPASLLVRHDQFAAMQVSMDNYRNPVQQKETMRLGALTGLKEHIKIRAGRYPSDKMTDDGYLEVLMCDQMMVSHGYVIGDTFQALRQVNLSGDIVKMRIVGVFDANPEIEDGYWVITPSGYASEFICDWDLFQEQFVTPEPQLAIKSFWYFLMDYSKVKPEMAEHLTEVCARYTESFRHYSDSSFRENFSDQMSRYLTDSVKVQTTLWVLQVPVFVLLGVFIFMVAKQMLELEQSEISIMKSRGAAKKQIIQIYLLQSVLTAFAGALIGLPFAFFLCQMIGSANAFLEFVGRAPLPMELTPSVILAGGAAVLFSIAVMVVPVFKYSDVTIVAQKQKKTRGKQAPWWQRYFVDILLLAVSLYGLYSFNRQKEALAAAVADGASLDPLLFLSSSLFIMGAGLVSLRIVPLVVKGIYSMGKKHWNPALYTSFLRVIRTRYAQSFIMIFLIVTVALGIFNAKAARTINNNEEEKIRYLDGADISLQERWQDNSASLEDGGELTYYEPDFDKYRVMPGVLSATRVYIDKKASISENSLAGVQLMGIHTKEFGETAHFDSTLLPEHWYMYLNRMAEDSTGIIVSSNFQTRFKYKLGDAITYRTSSGAMIRGTIVAFVDYWPGFNPYTYSRKTDGTYDMAEQYLVVAHLSRIQSYEGIRPYQVWLKTDGSAAGIYQAIEEKGIYVTNFNDAADEIVRLKNNAVFQGTNGILTVGFIVVLVLAVAGFLIYWILSIQSRSLQFGIFRAMGMTKREILTGLVNEQVFITGSSLAIGAVVGILASHLYIPLIQISYASYDQPLPLRIAEAASDSIRLFVIIGLAIAICMGILSWIISRIHISQALKLGED